MREEMQTADRTDEREREKERKGEREREREREATRQPHQKGKTAQVNMEARSLATRVEASAQVLTIM